MKLVTLALVAASSVVLFADGKTATASAPVAVHIVSPITLVSNWMGQGMEFGKVVADDPGSAVVITLTPTDGNNFLANKTIVNGSNLSSSQQPVVPFFHARYDSEIGWGGLTVTADPEVVLAPGVKLVPDLATGLGFRYNNCTYLPAGPGQTSSHFPLGGTLTADPGVYGIFHGDVHVTVAYN